MRKSFDFGTIKSLSRWFPRHMGKGLKQMQYLQSKIDCVIEVHDCRIPFTGRNPNLAEALSSKPTLLVLNKMDLANPTDSEIKALKGHFWRDGISDCILTNCQPGENGILDLSIQQIIPSCSEIIDRQFKFDREAEASRNLMVVGVPNVGKSSLINALRRHYMGKGGGAAVGKLPGYTRSVMNKVKVCESPVMYLYDTPGIVEPRIQDMHCGMKLAVCNTVQDHLIGTTMIADYLLFLLNKHKKFRYVEVYSFKEPVDDIQPVLYNIAIAHKKYSNKKIFTGTGSESLKIPDYDYAANVMLTDFRSGKLGRFVLDTADLEKF